MTKTITVAGERLTSGQQEVLIAADSETGAEFSLSRRRVFDDLRKRDLIYIWKYKDERWTYRTTASGKVIADAIEAYRKGEGEAKFWIVGTPDGPEEIYEGTERPKMLYDGGPYNRCSVAYDTLESLQMVCGMIERCRECDGLINHHWTEPTRSRLIAQKLCFGCDHWMRLLGNEKARVIVNGSHYMIERELPERDRSFGGHGGSRFVIEFFDGKTVTTHNLWHQGTIPAHFRDRMPDNARFVK